MGRREEGREGKRETERETERERQTERERDRQAQGREVGEVELWARERDVEMREGAQR